METLKARRLKRGVSQRQLALKADVAFRTVQLLESGRHDARLSTLGKVSRALGLSDQCIERAVRRCFGTETDSILDVSERICLEGEASWSVHIFNFVDAFRRQARPGLVARPPDQELSARLEALLASTVETLCEESGIPVPGWVWGVSWLDKPWFVSGVESLKALALVHSSVHFRKRNLFVLDNFLHRA